VESENDTPTQDLTQQHKHTQEYVGEPKNVRPPQIVSPREQHSLHEIRQKKVYDQQQDGRLQRQHEMVEEPIRIRPQFMPPQPRQQNSFQDIQQKKERDQQHLKNQAHPAAVQAPSDPAASERILQLEQRIKKLEEVGITSRLILSLNLVMHT
jgi:hypothetical protein